MGDDLTEKVPNSKAMYNLAYRLFPICRSITGDGVRESLRILDDYIGENISYTIAEIPSGTKVFDWKIPKEWRITEAYIENDAGERIIDFNNNNLHVLGYSAPIDRWVSLKEIDSYIYTQKDQPDVIPYVTSYYREASGFCMSEKQKLSLRGEKFHIYIDSELFDGYLTYGEILIPGETEEEILFTTYICHPSMANNECSGPVLQAELIKYVSTLKSRRYSYRFIIAPETIGAIAYLATDDHINKLKKNVVAGFVLTCVGDDRDFSLVESRYANTLADKILTHVFEYGKVCKGKYSRYSYLERGSDERQYGAPGVDLPIVTFCRSKFHVYSEYHTSADDMELVSEIGFLNSFYVMKDVIDILENNYKYKCSVICEPQLGRRGLYPDVSQKNTKGDISIIQDILAYADGRNDLVDMGNLFGRSGIEIVPIIEILKEKDLIHVEAGTE